MPVSKAYPVPAGSLISRVINLDAGMMLVMHVPHTRGDHIATVLTDARFGAVKEVSITAFGLDEPIVLTLGTSNGAAFTFSLSETDRALVRAAFARGGRQ
ncbi:MAG: hypothetical protein KDJ47_08510 [Hyphomicrobiaceae bacterium]|nr:hypothetical protein [Hyphomicrobiaceae bacterium]